MTELERYILDYTSEEDAVLKELDRQTHLRVLQPRMISGHLQGKILQMLVAMFRPRIVLELGTFTGYSAIAMAMGFGENEGIIHTVDINDELESLVEEFLEKSGMKNRVVRHVGPALEIVPRLGEVFDLVFIDADKREYPEYYSMLMDGGYVRPGSVILADNTLWSGKVIEPLQRNDRQTEGLLRFNEMVKQDERVEQVILPLRDGMTIIRVR